MIKAIEHFFSWLKLHETYEHHLLPHHDSHDLNKIPEDGFICVKIQIENEIKPKLQREQISGHDLIDSSTLVKEIKLISLALLK